MRLHIELDDDVIAEIDRSTGPRGRSRFIRRAIELSLRHERQRTLLSQVRGALQEGRHEWDHDPAGWVRSQRRGDDRRVG